MPDFLCCITSTNSFVVSSLPAARFPFREQPRHPKHPFPPSPPLHRPCCSLLPAQGTYKSSPRPRKHPVSNDAEMAQQGWISSTVNFSYRIPAGRSRSFPTVTSCYDGDHQYGALISTSTKYFTQDHVFVFPWF